MPKFVYDSLLDNVVEVNKALLKKSKCKKECLSKLEEKVGELCLESRKVKKVCKAIYKQHKAVTPKKVETLKSRKR